MSRDRNTTWSIMGAAGAMLLSGGAALAQPCIDVYALTNCPLGQAVLLVDPTGNLVVTNIGSSGEDGVTIGGTLAPIEDALVCIMPPGPVLMGAHIEVAATGHVQGVPGEVPLGRARVTELGLMNLKEITCDFSMLGADSYDVAIYQEGVLVYSQEGLTGPLGTVADWPMLATKKKKQCAFTFAGGGTEIVLHQSGDVLTGEKIVLSTAVSTVVESISCGRLKLKDLSSLTITDEAMLLADGTAIAYGIPNTPMGDAVLGLDDDCDSIGDPPEIILLVTDIGLTGNDGVQIEAPPGGGAIVGAHYSFFEAWPSRGAGGSHIQVGAHGILPGGPNVTYWVCTVERLPSIPQIQYELSVDYTTIGATSHAIEVYDDGQQVYATTGHTGPVALTTDQPIGLGVEIDQAADLPYILHKAMITYPPDTQIEIIGREIVYGDEVVMIAEDPQMEPETMERASLTGMDVSEVRVRRERIDSLPPCPADINGDGTVDVLDLLMLLAAWGNPGGGEDINGDGIVDVQDLLELLAAWGPCGLPRIGDVWHDDCTPSPGGPEEWCDPDVVDVTVQGNALQITHENGAYNCCLDDIAVNLTVQGNELTLIEEEIVTMPCPCICCYTVHSSVVDLTPGTYTVVYCWDDEDSMGQECHEEVVVVP